MFLASDRPGKPSEASVVFSARAGQTRLGASKRHPAQDPDDDPESGRQLPRKSGGQYARRSRSQPSQALKPHTRHGCARPPSDLRAAAARARPSQRGEDIGAQTPTAEVGSPRPPDETARKGDPRRPAPCRSRVAAAVLHASAAWANHPSLSIVPDANLGFCGQVAEWSIAPHSKCGDRASGPGVRIPPCPPSSHRKLRQRPRLRKIFVFFQRVLTGHPNLREWPKARMRSPTGFGLKRSKPLLIRFGFATRYHFSQFSRGTPPPRRRRQAPLTVGFRSEPWDVSPDP